MFELHGVKSIFPMDSYLGISGLPFKITPAAMLKIAYWAQNQSSYQRAEDVIAETMHVKINDDTVRQVANFVGNLVFQNDCKRAEDAFGLLCNRVAVSTKRNRHVLYIQTDGAALNTRSKDEEGCQLYRVCFRIQEASAGMCFA